MCRWGLCDWSGWWELPGRGQEGEVVYPQVWPPARGRRHDLKPASQNATHVVSRPRSEGPSPDVLLILWEHP